MITKRGNYFGAYAFNGLGVYTNRSKLRRDQEYMRGEHIQGFNTKEEAVRFAEKGFSNLQGTDSLMDTIPDNDDLRTNWFFFYKKNYE